METRSNRLATRTLVYGAILTAIVFVLQYFGAAIKFGTFSITLVLIPIVIGAALCGPLISTWLGLVFGIVVLWSGDAALFLGINAPGTIITVLLKGALCGLAAGLVFRAISKFNKLAAVFAAAVVCPVVNTGVFLLGCVLFFMDWVTEAAGGAGVWSFMLIGLVGLNFVIEMVVNLVLSPTVVKLVNVIESKLRS